MLRVFFSKYSDTEKCFAGCLKFTVSSSALVSLCQDSLSFELDQCLTWKLL